MKFEQPDYRLRDPQERIDRDALILFHSLGEAESRFVDGAVILDAECRAVSSWDQAVQSASQFAGSCLVMKAEPPSMFALLDQVNDSEQPICLAFLLDPWDSSFAIELMQRGAVGIFSISDSLPGIVEQLRRVFGRSRHLQAGWELVIQQRQRLARLNDKEQVVLKNVLAGLPNKSIAKKLEVSQRTVESRRHEIFRKTETTNLVALAKLVFEAKLPQLLNGYDSSTDETGQEDESLIGSESTDS